MAGAAPPVEGKGVCGVIGMNMSVLLHVQKQEMKAWVKRPGAQGCCLAPGCRPGLGAAGRASAAPPVEEGVRDRCEKVS